MAGDIELHALQALHGDSFVIKYKDNTGLPTHLIIDGGPPKAWEKSLRDEIETLELVGGKPQVRLCVLTHADEDHVGGLLKLFSHIGDNPNTIKVWEVWLNAFPKEPLPKQVGAGRGAVPESIAQTNDLLTQVRQLQILINRTPSLNLRVDGLDATVVAPDTEALAKLAKTWAKKASTDALMEAYKDNSVYNRSSIVLLIEKGGANLLMCGDARGDDILKGLENTGKLKEVDPPLRLDLLKIPHHGGDNNCTQDFFKRLPAKNYLISTDGAKFPHPHPAMLADLFAARKAAFPSDPFKIHLTTDIDELGDKADVPAIKAAIAKAKADGLKFTVEKITGPLSF